MSNTHELCRVARSIRKSLVYANGKPQIPEPAFRCFVQQMELLPAKQRESTVADLIGMAIELRQLSEQATMTAVAQIMMLCAAGAVESRRP